MCSKRRPSDDVGGPFLFLVLTISPPLRFGPALCPAAEEALGRQVSEHQRDGSATIQAQIHHRQALLAPHRSVGSRVIAHRASHGSAWWPFGEMDAAGRLGIRKANLDLELCRQIG